MPVTRISWDLPCSVKRGAGLWMGAQLNAGKEIDAKVSEDAVLTCSVKRGAGLWMGARRLPSIGPVEAMVRTGDV